MKSKSWIALVIVAACNGTVVEPIEVDESSYPVSDLDPSGAGADATYGCDLVQWTRVGERRSIIEGDVVMLTDFGHIVWGARCKQPGDGEPNLCWNWQTAPWGCFEGDSPGPLVCGGYQGSYDEQSNMTRFVGAEHVSCRYPCRTDADCPAPSTGTAHATCQRRYHDDSTTGPRECTLGCDRGETCPDGFLCLRPTNFINDVETSTTYPGPAECQQYLSIDHQFVGRP